MLFQVQSYKAIPVEFIKDGTIIKNVNYFYLKDKKAYKIKQENNKLLIDGIILHQPSIVLLAIVNKKIINFRVETNTFYFIKIKEFTKRSKPTNFVNFGSEYDEIVVPSRLGVLAFGK